MTHCSVKLPKDKKVLKQIFDLALSKSFNSWVDEKGTEDHPNILYRQRSKLSYEEAYNIIQANKPHNVCIWRNMERISETEKSYWEFGCCNIATVKEPKGEYFIFILVEESIALEIIELFNLKQDWY